MKFKNPKNLHFSTPLARHYSRTIGGKGQRRRAEGLIVSYLHPAGMRWVVLVAAAGWKTKYIEGTQTKKEDFIKKNSQKIKSNSITLTK